ncbi:MAG: hypothetical protein GY702_27810 [Desulfobulbaceae bacterium]|nr:hypothetical protein [Desulfobulbaceae bacterium]
MWLFIMALVVMAAMLGFLMLRNRAKYPRLSRWWFSKKADPNQALASTLPDSEEPSREGTMDHSPYYAEIEPKMNGPRPIEDTRQPLTSPTESTRTALPALPPPVRSASMEARAQESVELQTLIYPQLNAMSAHYNRK